MSCNPLQHKLFTLYSKPDILIKIFDTLYWKPDIPIQIFEMKQQIKWRVYYFCKHQLVIVFCKIFDILIFFSLLLKTLKIWELETKVNFYFIFFLKTCTINFMYIFYFYFHTLPIFNSLHHIEMLKKYYLFLIIFSQWFILHINHLHVLFYDLQTFHLMYSYLKKYIRYLTFKFILKHLKFKCLEVFKF